MKPFLECACVHTSVCLTHLQSLCQLATATCHTHNRRLKTVTSEDLQTVKRQGTCSKDRIIVAGLRAVTIWHSWMRIRRTTFDTTNSFSSSYVLLPHDVKCRLLDKRSLYFQMARVKDYPQSAIDVFNYSNTSDNCIR